MTTTATKIESLDQALQCWADLAREKAATAEAYRVAHAKAWLAPEKATETARKAQADLETAALRVARDACAINERLAHHSVIFFRGSAGEGEGE